VNLDALDHDRYTERALELAREAVARGDEPFGSLLVHDGEIVAEARNAVTTEDDLRRHPELDLAYRAARKFDEATRRETVMYTSTEPCPMCAGGIAIADLGAVVYSVSAKRLGELLDGSPGVPCGEVFKRRGADIQSMGPVLSDAGEAVHRDYWPSLGLRE
jgi:tRNA(Arg) A34 adenosine deaminase TadA